MCLNFTELEVVDKEISKLVDIGFPAPKRNRSDDLKKRGALYSAQRQDASLERAARLNQCNFRLFLGRSEWRFS